MIRTNVEGSTAARRVVRIVVAVSALLVLGCPSMSAATPARAPVWNIVALGDSDATGEGDATGLGWVGRYARLIRQELGFEVRVTNLAEGGKLSVTMLADLESDPETRAAVRSARIVLIGIGGADLGAGDLRLEAGRCEGDACYAADLRAFGRNLDAAAALVRGLRSSKQAVLRAITLPNVIPGARDVVPEFLTPELGVYQTTTLRRHICRAMANHQGRCVDVLRKFNGPEANENAYAKGWLTKDPCCYPSGNGQQVMAGLVFRTGLAPLR